METVMNLLDPQIWASLLTLTALEIVLAVDNLIFLTVMTRGLPERDARRVRTAGLGGALVMRLVLLAGIVWVAGLTQSVVTVFDFAVSWRDLILAGGGLFLLYKGTFEIHHSVEGDDHEPRRARAGFAAAIAQVMALDLVFSLDSIVTAVGMAEHFWVMATAVIIAIGVMLVAANTVGDFVARHPTVKMLALSFLILVGVALVADGMHFHIPRGYLYFAIAFSAGVEALNLLVAGRRRKARRAEA